MAIEFCPLEAEWGSWADWAAVAVAGWGALAAVVVGTGAAAATVWVALLAHRTSRRATEIAEGAKLIAQQQHDEAVKLRQDTARVLGRLLQTEVTVLPERIAHVLRAWEAAIAWGETIAIRNDRAFEVALEQAGLQFLPGAEAAEARIHNLPDSLGADLATLIGSLRSMNHIAKRMAAKVRYSQMPADLGGKTTILYAGNHRDFSELRKNLLWHLEVSLVLAGDLQDFIGVAREAYGSQRELLKTAAR